MDETRFSLEGYPDLTGCLADIARWFMQTAVRPRKEAAYIVALSFGSVICGRFFEFERSFSSNYICVLAGTGVGKQDLIRAITDLANAMECPRLIMNANSFTSDAGCHAAMATQPQSICLIDEFGSILEAMNASAVSQTALTTLTRAFTSVDSSLTPKAYSDSDSASMKMQTIIRPALTLLGFGNPDDITRNLTPESFTSGQMSRYLFFQMTDEPVHTTKNTLSPPENVVSELSRVLFHKQKLNGECCLEACHTTIPPAKCTLEMGELNTSDLDYRQQELVYKSREGVQKALLTRRLEKAKRLAIVLSLLGTYGTSLEDVIITQAALRDALSIVQNSDELIISILDGVRPYPPRIYDTADQVEAFLNGQFEAGFTRISKADVAKNCPLLSRCNTQAQGQVYDLLMDREIATQHDGKGKNAPIYFIPYTNPGSIDQEARITRGLY